MSLAAVLGAGVGAVLFAAALPAVPQDVPKPPGAWTPEQVVDRLEKLV